MDSARMGELITSNTPGDIIGVIGLGSCIGLALIDARAGVAGIAHIVLPDSRDAIEPVGKFANLAVPALIAQVLARGASRYRLVAALAGGARMFAMPGVLDIGSANDAAVRTYLQAERISIVKTATGGSRGRTIRIYVESGEVTSQETGGSVQTLISGAAMKRVA
jgi:chemotaxis protein CheD